MYDYIIVTHIPAFYKVNLYNELAKKLKILVVFIASNTAEKRADDFTTLKNVSFSYEVLYNGDFQARDKKLNIKKLKTILKNSQYKRLLVSGWDLKEFWYLVMFYPKSKNCLALESTILESTPKGMKGWIKKVFLSRISTVFASGNLHVKLLKALSFKDDIKITKGVGIINKPNYKRVKKVYQKRFLYVGRTSQVKNLEALIIVFNDLPNHYLTIIGDGEEKEYLQSIANQNISFKPPIENIKLQTEFLDHDIFILPSISETWGLVIEEALYFCLPVMLSKNCGSVELVQNGVNGYVFDHMDMEEIKQLILSIDDVIYQKLLDGVSEFSIYEKDLKQVLSYDIK
ncbi:glycosyltransferase [Aliarcobacter cryaerophilus]|uniref:glycosyltransferase n=1 Tax=Aliarcobacter cryaerophilus TaxID=28198 RepID=UPI003DA5BDF1